jgi:hypothetical protein
MTIWVIFYKSFLQSLNPLLEMLTCQFRVLEKWLSEKMRNMSTFTLIKRNDSEIWKLSRKI